MINKRKAYVEKLGVQLDEWNEKIDQFKARADKASTDTKKEYQRMIEVLQHKREEARTKLHELGTSSEDAWDDIATGADIIWTEIKKTFQGAASKFK